MRLSEAADILLLIEASDSSLAFDQGTKLALYARNAVPEYWVVDVQAGRVMTYLEPARRDTPARSSPRQPNACHPGHSPT